MIYIYYGNLVNSNNIFNYFQYMKNDISHIFFISINLYF